MIIPTWTMIKQAISYAQNNYDNTMIIFISCHIDCALQYFECVLFTLLQCLLLLSRSCSRRRVQPHVRILVHRVRQQGKHPLFDHVDKIPVPSHSHLCMFRMSSWYVLPLVEPIPLHDLSFYHSSKQTKILADLGVECWSCGPCNYYSLLHAQSLQWFYLYVSRDGSDHVNDGGNMFVNWPKQGERWEAA